MEPFPPNILVKRRDFPLVKEERQAPLVPLWCSILLPTEFIVNDRRGSHKPNLTADARRIVFLQNGLRCFSAAQGVRLAGLPRLTSFDLLS
jgi:hypothetical protein